MNQEAASTENRVFCWEMIRTRNSTSAGAIRFRAVPPMVWSARRLTEAKDSSREKAAPVAAATSMARSSSPCSAI